MIDVIDSGVGLNHELDEHIFEKGFSSKGENRGYGLHLVQQSVEKLDGQISINAHEAGNVQFSVVINYPKKDEDKC